MLKVVVNSKAVQGAKIVVHNGDKIVISDGQTGQSPKKIITKKVDKNLQIFEEGASEPTLVLENYYNDGVPAQISGLDASGGYLPYTVADSGSMELLSSPLEATAAGEPAVAATAGISTGTMIGLGALGAVGIAVAAGGGGGGSSTPADTTPPAAPTISTVAGNDIVTAAEKTAGVAITGTAEAGSTVTVTWGTTTKTTTATGGSYSVTFTESEIPADGSSIISVTAKDSANNTSAAATHTVTIDTQTSELVVADGYVSGAAIWIDTDGDGEKDFDTGILTDAQGNFTLDADIPAGTIIAIGGVNIDTGITNTMVLKAPSGSTVVNPLTTLVQAVIESDTTGATTAETASEQVAQALGITSGTDLTTFDPLDVDSDPTTALAAQQAAATVATILSIATDGADAATTATITDAIVQSLVETITTTQESIDLGNPLVIGALLEDAADTLAADDVTLSNQTLSDITTAAEEIAATESIDEISTAQETAMDEIPTTAPWMTAPVLTTASDSGVIGDGKSSDSTPEITFDALIGSTLSYTVNGGSATVISSETTTEAQSIPLSGLSEGDNTIVISATSGTETTTRTLNYTLDTTLPSVTITEDESATGNIAGGNITYTFTFSEPVSGFSVDDVTVANGAKGTFTAVSPTLYTLVVTPTAGFEGNVIVDVAAAIATDAAGNDNTVATQSVQTVDMLAPTATITMADSALKIGESSPVTIVFSEAVTNFANADVTVANGTLGTLVSSDGGVTWIAIFTPTVDITDSSNVITLADTYTDTALNTGTTATSANYTIDTLSPTATITMADPALKVGETSLVTIVFSEAVSGFANEDVTVDNGTLSPLTSNDSGITWTATFTPTADITDSSNVITLADTYTDLALNAGTTATSANYEIDVVVPILTITNDQTGTANIAGGDIVYTFTFSEAVTGFSADDVTVTNGTKGTFSGSGTTYTLAVTPATIKGDVTVDVASAIVTDAAGNANTAATPFVQSVDMLAPTITISTISGGYVNDAEDESVVTVAGTTTGVETGQIVTITINSVDYTATRTGNDWTVDIPSADIKDLSEGTIEVVANVSDAALNPAAQATQTFVYDITAPTVIISDITSDDVLNSIEVAAGGAISGTTTAEDGRTVTVKVDGTTIGTTTATAGVWSLLVNPTTLGTLTQGEHTITADVSDTAGNPAVQATHTFSVDTVTPTITMNPATADNILNAVENSNPTKTITGTTTAPDGQVVTYKVDGIAKGTGVVSGGAWTVTFEATAPFLSDGTHVRSAEVSDAAGNIAIVSSDFTVDTIAPVSLAYTLLDGTVTVNSVGLESEATWEYQIDGGTWTEGTAFTFDVSISGTSTFAIRQIDLAGNISAISSGTSLDGNPPANSYPYTMLNNDIMYIAKGVALDIDLQNYVRDPDGDTVTITVNTSDLPEGLTISNGIITGTTTDTAGAMEITLDDGNGGTSTRIINFTVIDTPESMTYVYGSTAPFDLSALTTGGAAVEFFTVDGDDGGVNHTIIDTDGSAWEDYEYDGSAYVSQDSGTFTASAIDSDSFTAAGEWGTESIVLTEIKAVDSINGTATPGLIQATATFTTIASPATVEDATDWWDSDYSYWDDEAGASVTATELTELRDVLIAPNGDSSVWISDDLQVKLLEGIDGTGGEIVAMVWDGTYIVWTDENDIQHINQHLVATDTVVGTWSLEGIYLTVTATDVGITAFQQGEGILLQTEIANVGSIRTETWFYGATFEQFTGVMIDLMNSGASSDPIYLGDVVIVTADTALVGTDITAFPEGTTYTDGEVTITFDTTTTATIVHGSTTIDMTIAGGSAVATDPDTNETFEYKLLSMDGETLTLIRVNGDIATDMNGDQMGPPTIWTLKTDAAEVQILPGTGSLTLYNTDTENFGDDRDMVKLDIDFETDTITTYAIDGTVSETITATRNANVLSGSVTNGTFDLTLLYADGSHYVLSEHGIDTWNWGTGSAQGAADMAEYLTARSGILWSENGTDYNHNGTVYDYGLVIEEGGTVTGYEDYISNLSDHSDEEIDETYSASMNGDNELVIDFGADVETYSVSSGMISVSEEYNMLYTMTTTNPFTYEYAYEIAIGNGTYGIGLHDGMALDVSDLSYDHALYGIDAEQDSGANTITITAADVLAQGVSYESNYGVGIILGEEDTVSLTEWIDYGNRTDMGGLTYNIYENEGTLALLYVSYSSQAPL